MSAASNPASAGFFHLSRKGVSHDAPDASPNLLLPAVRAVAPVFRSRDFPCAGRGSALPFFHSGHSGGEYSRTRTSVSAGYKWFTLSYLRSDYDWNQTNKVALGRDKGNKPWDHLHRLALDAKFDGWLTDNLGWFAGGTLVSGFETELSDSFSLIGRGGFSFALNPELNLRLGAIGALSPVHPMLIPLVELDWRHPADFGFSGNLGLPESSLRYRFNPMLAARASAYWSRTLHRLSDDSSVARKGYLEESGITTGAYLDFTFIESLNLTLGAELETWRELRIYNDDGDKLTKTDVDPSLGAVLRVGYSF